MENYVGYELGGKYRLDKRIRNGTFGDVYRGLNTSISQRVAIKLLRRNLSEKELEARILAKLDHPHIAKIFDYAIELSHPFDGMPYIVMEYAERGNLRDKHPARSKLEISEIVNYVDQIAPALQHAHDKQIIHLDIKPENILVKDNGWLLLCDFGIASMRGQILQTANGTPPYMAPEQIENKPSSSAADQYALGVMVYEWLCGEVPFTDWDYLLEDHHKIGTVPSLLKRNPSVSPAVERVIFRALEKEPTQRFESINEFAIAFKQAVAREQTLGPSVHVDNQSGHGQSSNPAQNDVSKPALTKDKHLAPRSVPRRRFLELLTGAVILSALAELAPKVVHSIIGPFPPPYPTITPTFGITQSPTVSPTIIPSPTSTLPPAGTTLYVFDGHTAPITRVAWTVDQEYIASASQDGSIQIWQSMNRNGYTYGSGLLRYQVKSSVNDLAMGRYDMMAFCTDTQVYQSYSRTPSSTHSLNLNPTKVSKIKAISWLKSPFTNKDRLNTQYMITVDDKGEVILNWVDIHGNWNPPVHLESELGSGLLTVAGSLDEQHFATGGNDKVVSVWKLEDSSAPANVTAYIISRLNRHSEVVNSIAWSPDGQSLASGSDDSTVKVWHAFQDGSSPYTNYQGHNGPVLQVAWAPNGKRIASAGSDGTVQVWDAISGKTFYTYHGHSGRVRSIAWSPIDGAMIASGGDDQYVRVWASGPY